MNPSTLLLVDLQNDFMPGGALAVSGANEVIPIANKLIDQFDLVVATQDWHPPDHGSFAASHEGHNVFDEVGLNGLPQTLWPTHCVENTGGALFAPTLNTAGIDRVFPKGTDASIDSYSGFYDNGKRASTGLGDWLREKGVTAITVLGVATDYCVKFTVLDALTEGFAVTLHVPGCRGVNLQEGDCERAIREMSGAGATLT
ncbi:MAG: bifunctional nicotinamidase/pyrazinamidase [Verrucomicrobiales bacterium]|nr:bifunctional nicotinamidase/pyrazinamidase [Verrucomicrobiales bacterium]